MIFATVVTVLWWHRSCPYKRQTIVEMITKHLEYYIDLADKAEAKFKRIGFNFERNAIKQHFMLQMEVCPIDGAKFIVVLF